MKHALILVTIFTTFLNGQELIRHFGLDRRNAYEYTAEYTFDTQDHDLKRILILKDLKGDIFIHGSIDPQVSIKETIIVHAPSKREAQKAIDRGKARVWDQVDNQIITVQSQDHASDLDLDFEYTIYHPKNVSVEIDALGGNILLENITGEINLNSMGGDLDFDRITGKIMGRTAGGDIRVTGSEGVFTIVTDGGDIDVRGSNGKFSGKTRGGDMNVESYNGDIELESSGGSIVLRRISGTSISGTTKGGDIDVEAIRANLSLKTHGGNIEIIDLDGNVRAETDAGDIEMMQIFGDVDITTLSGDIDCLAMYGPVKAYSSMGDIQVQKLNNLKIKLHDMDLYTKHGDISLKLPRELTIDLDAIVKHGDHDPSIISDIPIQIIQDLDETIGQALRGLDTIHHQIKLKSNRGIIIIEDL